MSFADAWAAINLDMPSRVPRTEYSVEVHWDVIKAVTGIQVNDESAADELLAARQAFWRAWNYGIQWSILISSDDLDKMRTRMGHAEYKAGGVDFDTEILCPFKTPEDVLSFDPWAVYGPIDKPETTRRFERHYHENTQTFDDWVAMTGIYITCISGLLEIFGWDMLLLAAGTDPKAFGEVTNRYASWIQQYFDALGDTDVPVVMVHDDIVWTSGPFIHPDWYRQYVFPNYLNYLEPLKASGKKILFTSDGTYTTFIDDLAACGVDGFVLEPTTDMAYIAENYGKTHSFIGNADVRVLMTGNREKIRAEVERCMAIGKHCPGFFLSVGNHIPPNTPVDSVLYYNDVYEELSRR